jgi:hypothetical protein
MSMPGTPLRSINRNFLQEKQKNIYIEYKSFFQLRFRPREIFGKLFLFFLNNENLKYFAQFITTLMYLYLYTSI